MPETAARGEHLRRFAASRLLAASRRVDPTAAPRGSAATPQSPGPANAEAARATASGGGRKKPAAARPVPRLRSAPGSRVASRFFDDYPRFYDTSNTSPHRDRLDLRYEAVFAENRDIIDGARVLDISSHDGRWAFAALESGARSVVGIEAKPELVAQAQENLAAYAIDADRYSFIAGDVFDVLAKQAIDVDLVLCLGFFYHTLRYNELLHRIRLLDPRHVILDTQVAGGAVRPLVRIRAERIGREGNAVADEFSYGERVMAGDPSIAALRVMMDSYGYEIERFSDWRGLLRDNPQATHVNDYRRVSRVTARCRAIDGA